MSLLLSTESIQSTSSTDSNEDTVDRSTKKYRYNPINKKRVNPIAKHARVVPNPYPSTIWSPLKIWVESYNCEICKDLMTGKHPQKLHHCDHVFCSECIHNHYNVKYNIKCPVCEVYINPNDITTW